MKVPENLHKSWKIHLSQNSLVFIKTEKQRLVPVVLVTSLIVFAPCTLPYSRPSQVILAPTRSLSSPSAWILTRSAACSTGGQCAPAQAQHVASLPFICHCPAWLGPTVALVFHPRNGRIALLNNSPFVDSNSQSSRSFCPGNLFIVPVYSKMQGWNPYRFPISIKCCILCFGSKSYPCPSKSAPLCGGAAVVGIMGWMLQDGIVSHGTYCYMIFF